MGLAFAPQSAVAAEPGDYLLGSAIPPSPSRDTSTYEIASPDVANGPINVTFVIEAGNEIWDEDGEFRAVHNVTLSNDVGIYTVTDLLVVVDSDPSYDLTFYGKSSTGLIPITSTTDYVAAVEHDGTTWEEGQLGYDGWVFRVNDKFLVFTDGEGYIGASILQTNISDGDVVHMFYDFPADLGKESGSFSASYARGIYEDSGARSLTVQLQGHTTFISPLPPQIMYVDNYNNLQGGVTAYLYDPTGTLIGTETSNVNGLVTFSGSFRPGTYILTTDSVYHRGYSAIPDDTYFALTGAYSKILIQ
jgi:hypothetical protein